jgi:hypothetical protein
MESTSKQNGQTNRGRLLAISASTGEPHPLYSEHHKRIADITERLCMPLVGNEDVVLGFLDNAVSGLFMSQPTITPLSIGDGR